MRWSKLRSLIHEGFADSVKDRVQINSAAYGNCSCGHAWLTLDGELIANFCTRAYYNRNYYDLERKQYLRSDVTAEEKKRYRNQLVEYGDFSRQDLYKSCWEFLHDLTIEAALNSSDVLTQSLALLDKRVGKRRLAKIDSKRQHPLARTLFNERVLADKQFKTEFPVIKGRRS